MLALSKRFLPALRKLRLTDWVAFVLLAVYVATFSWMAIRQHAGFRTQALDLAKFDQAIWNTARGHPFRITLIQSSVIQSHFSPSLALYAPLYWLWDDVRLLFVAQSICLGGAGFLVYWFFRRDAPWLGLVVYAAYLMHPSLHHVNLIEFRRVTIAVLASSFALYHMLRRRYVWMLVGLSIALLSKEDLAFLVIGVGLYVVLAHRSFKVGIPLLIVGLAWLVLVPFVILPDLSVSHSDLSSETYVHSRKNFSYLGESPVEMLQTLWRNPTAPLRYVLRPERMTAVFHLCWPTAFLFLLAPEITAFTLPFLGYLLASKYNVMGTLGAWYPSVLLPILYWAVAVGISRVRGRWRMVMLAALLACGFGGWFLNGEVWPGHRFAPGRFEVSTHHRQVEAILRRIPTDAIVAAQDPLVPHLSHREQIYLFPWVPEDVQPDYVVLDREMGIYPVEIDAYRSLFYDLLAGTEYEVDHQVDSFYVFRYVGDVSPAVAREDQWDGALTLIGYSAAAAPPGEAFGPVAGELPTGTTMRLSLFWRVDQPMEQNYTVFVHLLSVDGRMLAQHDAWPADAHRPTSVLSPGDVVRDVHYLAIPETIPATVVVHVGLYEGITGRHLLLQDGREAVTLSIWP
jgi:uncharacterized membrane protein